MNLGHAIPAGQGQQPLAPIGGNTGSVAKTANTQSLQNTANKSVVSSESSTGPTTRTAKTPEALRDVWAQSPPLQRKPKNNTLLASAGCYVGASRLRDDASKLLEKPHKIEGHDQKPDIFPGQTDGASNLIPKAPIAKSYLDKPIEMLDKAIQEADEVLNYVKSQQESRAQSQPAEPKLNDNIANTSDWLDKTFEDIIPKTGEDEKSDIDKGKNEVQITKTPASPSKADSPKELKITDETTKPKTEPKVDKLISPHTAQHLVEPGRAQPLVEGNKGERNNAASEEQVTLIPPSLLRHQEEKIPYTALRSTLRHQEEKIPPKMNRPAEANVPKAQRASPAMAAMAGRLAQSEIASIKNDITNFQKKCEGLTPEEVNKETVKMTQRILALKTNPNIDNEGVIELTASLRENPSVSYHIVLHTEINSMLHKNSTILNNISIIYDNIQKSGTREYYFEGNDVPQSIVNIKERYDIAKSTAENSIKSEKLTVAWVENISKIALGKLSAVMEERLTDIYNENKDSVNNNLKAEFKQKLDEIKGNIDLINPLNPQVDMQSSIQRFIKIADTAFL